ncbi:hypothetical protein CLOSYM_02806 [[Clostridium] symbiosum ATCC 14940]|uniref:Uncharacterized protein n=1 Tax=[Clostridium] symbiosum ATCC 14940 TaxID=411472 RepID=A0ABC9TW90_CLOSY|nr:hypothetical protein CLOSYM_02806 [[Clostridium] symbiosum ATCC 14940]
MFSLFLRKSRVMRRDAMKSELFTTINGAFSRFCASFVAVWPKAEL